MSEGVLDPCSFPTHFPSISFPNPSLPAIASPSEAYRLADLFSDFFFLFKFSSQILTFLDFFSISGRPGVDFSPFFLPKRVPGGYFFGVFSKTVILLKSCSHCGGSTILKGQTLQESVRGVTPNSDGSKQRKKSLPAPPPDALFRLRAGFWSILGPFWAPLAKSLFTLFGHFFDIFRFFRRF